MENCNKTSLHADNTAEFFGYIDVKYVPHAQLPVSRPWFRIFIFTLQLLKIHASGWEFWTPVPFPTDNLNNSIILYIIWSFSIDFVSLSDEYSFSNLNWLRESS